jgi:hypothetical protein
MTYYCSTADVADRMGLSSQERLAANSRLTGAIRRATIEIDQEFFDRGRSEPSKSTSETTSNGSTSVGATTTPLTNADAFSTAANGNIDGDSFTWTGKDGGISALSIANAGDGYSAGTLTATGGTGSGFAGTYGISALTSAYTISGTNTTCQAGNYLVNGVVIGAYIVHFQVNSITLGGTNTGALADDGSADGTGTFNIGSSAGGTFTVTSGVISNIVITDTTYYPSIPPITVADSTSFGNSTLTAVLKTAGQLQTISITDTTKYASTPTITSSSSFGNAAVTATLSTTGIISSTSITSAGIYTVAPTAIVISNAGNGVGSIASTFTFNRLTGCTGISFDHSSGVAVQEGEMAHILREVCADIAAGFIYEDQAVFGDGKDLRSNTFRQRGMTALKRLAHHGGIA